MFPRLSLRRAECSNREGSSSFPSHTRCLTPHHKNLRGADGRTYAYEVGGYFTACRARSRSGSFSAAPPEVVQGLPKFHAPRYTHTLSQWLNMLIDQGFVIERR